MTKPLRPAGALLILLVFIGCDDKATSSKTGPKEHIDAAEREIAAKLKPAKDPDQDEIYAFRLKMRNAYNARRFDELEQQASDILKKKETFGNGSWKIVQFHNSFEPRAEEAESMWALHEKIHRGWMTAKPESMTACVAYAQFLVDYAWHARGGGYADTVTQDGWRLFAERLTAARETLNGARRLPVVDPQWWMTALAVALGQGWSKQEYDDLMAEAVAVEPKFWGYDTSRAWSLMPRWHGEPGDWEAYAAQAAERPDGLGAEVYARIVIRLQGTYDNIFRESKASWPKTKEGLELMRKKYPDSLEILSRSAKLATFAADRECAKGLFEQLGDKYLPDVWGKPERFAHYRNWANTGKW